jgi:hypothetical protein
VFRRACAQPNIITGLLYRGTSSEDGLDKGETKLVKLELKVTQKRRKGDSGGSSYFYSEALGSVVLETINMYDEQ